MLYRYDDGCNKTNTIQVKMSRTYYNDKEDSGYPFYLWFNRFPVQQNANWYILVGIYAKHSDEPNAGVKSTTWDTIMLAFTNKEMSLFMSEVKQKKTQQKMIECSVSDLIQVRLFIKHEVLGKFVI